jgi:micrococcal nuclease
MKKYILALILGFLSVAAFAVPGTVTEVIDGDTVWVQKADNQKFKLRLRYADAPEICQAYGPESKAYLESLVLGKAIDFKLAGKSYDRAVGVVTVGTTDLSTVLISTGNAWLQKTGTPKKSPLRALEAEARNNKVGLWSLENPVDPAQFRKQKHCSYKKK